MKAKTIYYCVECGSEYSRWSGQCSVCGAWNTLAEKKVEPAKKDRNRELSFTEAATPIAMPNIQESEAERLPVDFEEWDRTLGGGVVKGSLLLLGGDPGVGKSTLVLQVADKVAKRYGIVLYASGEESASQIRLRSKRLNTSAPQCFVYASTNLNRVLEEAKAMQPALLVVDSIQTMYVEEIQGAPGSISQVKECTALLLRFAKDTGITVIIIGHVTKEGNIAGPRMLEHMVDAVLYLEGEAGHSLRILRAVKNRFGNTSESGVFTMEANGLKEISDLSHLLLSERSRDRVGTVVYAGVDGFRPLLAEVQALTNHSFYGNARRTSIGYDFNRLVVLLAVLEKKAGLHIAEEDVYVNVAGGIKIADPAIDLAVAAAIISVQKEMALSPSLAVMGEVSLTGDVCRVDQMEKRLQELAKMGFRKVILPEANKEQINCSKWNLELHGIGHVREIVNLLRQKT